MVSIGDLPGGVNGGGAYGTSGNGSIIVGSGVSESGIEAFRWSEMTGMVGLGDLSGGGFFSEAYDVSADGSVIVGRSSAAAGPFNTRAFRWTAETGMAALPDGNAQLGATRTAEAISGDGNVIVGSTWGIDSAFAWDSFHGTRSIRELLASQGADVAGWDLGIARGISDDGLTIVGQGLPPGSRTRQPWVARLDAGTFIPEPNSFVLIGVALLAAVCATRGRVRVDLKSNDSLLV
jgi:probable HAF family extracellular repeat protein